MLTETNDFQHHRSYILNLNKIAQANQTRYLPTFTIAQNEVLQAHIPGIFSSYQNPKLSTDTLPIQKRILTEKDDQPDFEGRAD